MNWINNTDPEGAGIGISPEGMILLTTVFLFIGPKNMQLLKINLKDPWRYSSMVLAGILYSRLSLDSR